jgi:hypothetical protein
MEEDLEGWATDGCSTEELTSYFRQAWSEQQRQRASLQHSLEDVSGEDWATDQCSIEELTSYAREPSSEQQRPRALPPHGLNVPVAGAEQEFADGSAAKPSEDIAGTMGASPIRAKLPRSDDGPCGSQTVGGGSVPSQIPPPTPPPISSPAGSSEPRRLGSTPEIQHLLRTHAAGVRMIQACLIRAHAGLFTMLHLLCGPAMAEMVRPLGFHLPPHTRSLGIDARTRARSACPGQRRRLVRLSCSLGSAVGFRQQVPRTE